MITDYRYEKEVSPKKKKKTPRTMKCLIEIPLANTNTVFLKSCAQYSREH